MKTASPFADIFSTVTIASIYINMQISLQALSKFLIALECWLRVQVQKEVSGSFPSLCMHTSRLVVTTYS
jgi:hypothetical protein